MNRFSDGAPDRSAAAPWQQVWLERYSCDMPSEVPYPRAPVTALVDQFYGQVQSMGGNRWDTSSLIALLQR